MQDGAVWFTQTQAKKHQVIMYVRADGWMDDGWEMDDGWMHACVGERMDGWVDRPVCWLEILRQQELSDCHVFERQHHGSMGSAPDRCWVLRSQLGLKTIGHVVRSCSAELAVGVVRCVASLGEDVYSGSLWLSGFECVLSNQSPGFDCHPGSWVTLGELINFFGCQFPHLQTEAYFMERME